jgi:transcriptional regulator with XRE-family HTH domain
MSDYVTANRERNARIIATRSELIARRDEAWAPRKPDHIDLRPAHDVRDPATGRTELAPDPKLVLIGRYLRRARRYAQKSQQRVADETGVTQSMVSRAERGLAPGMRFVRFARMCEALGRLFPLGACPHDHDCAWQPIKPPKHQTSAVERLIALLLDPNAESRQEPGEDANDE